MTLSQLNWKTPSTNQMVFTNYVIPRGSPDYVPGVFRLPGDLLVTKIDKILIVEMIQDEKSILKNTYAII